MVDIAAYIKNLRYETKALLFDWGNTVMKVFPDQQGPMAHWTKIAEVPGIRDVLSQFVSKYKIVLVSNASDSDQKLVRQALERVDLAGYFHHIFTPRELLARKPAPDFYLNILKAIDVEPEHAIMIGDDYENDIIAAKQVGLYTIWFNADQHELQNIEYPYHDVEVGDLRDLTRLIQEQIKFW